MAGQRLLNKEVDDRAIFKINKSIKKVDDGVNGIIFFGENNDYAQLMEKLINGSPTAKACASIYGKFLSGQGFEADINEIIVGKDERGKKITVHRILKDACQSAARNQGFYIHRNCNLNGVTSDIHLKPFKNCRFAEADDNGYSAKIAYYTNWEKDTKNKKYKPSDIKIYNVFNNDLKALEAQMSVKGSKGKFKGQIYFEFLDNEFFYPLSTFDVCYLDCDTENQIALYENRETRDGFFDKVIIRLAAGGTEEEQGQLVKRITNLVGVNSERVVVITADVDEDGNILENKDFRIDTIKSNASPELFEGLKKSAANTIRKSIKIPAILIDYEENKLGGTSGEAIIQATNFFNAITKEDRSTIENAFKEILSTFDIPELKNNTNWKIKPLNLIEQQKDGITDTSTTTAI